MDNHAEDFNAAVGRQLRAEIAAGGSNIASMSRAIGIARSALDNYVSGKRAIPVTVAYAICAELGVAPHTVVERAEERMAETPLPAPIDFTSRRRSNVSGADETDDLLAAASDTHNTREDDRTDEHFFE